MLIRGTALTLCVLIVRQDFSPDRAAACNTASRFSKIRSASSRWASRVRPLGQHVRRDAVDEILAITPVQRPSTRLYACANLTCPSQARRQQCSTQLLVIGLLL